MNELPRGHFACVDGGIRALDLEALDGNDRIRAGRACGSGHDPDAVAAPCERERRRARGLYAQYSKAARARSPIGMGDCDTVHGRAIERGLVTLCANGFGEQAAEQARGPFDPGRVLEIGDRRVVDLHRHALHVEPAICLRIEHH